MVALCRRSVVKRLGAVWAGLMVGLLLASGAQAQQLAWTEMGGAAVDIGVVANGTVWVTNAGGGIYRWTNGGWNQMPGAAVRVSVDPKGNAWVVNSGSHLHLDRQHLGATTGRPVRHRCWRQRHGLGRQFRGQHLPLDWQ